MLGYFLDLVRIDSLSRKEGKVAQKLASDLKNLGLEVESDDAGKKVGGDVGNLIARLPGDPKLPAFLLSAHMDTVGPGEGIKPIVKGDKVATNGTTILGADCKSGLAVIFEALNQLVERDLPHGDVELAITICEEVGLLGAKHLDVRRFKSKLGLVLDSMDPLELTYQAPTADHMTYTVLGRESHSGSAPEKGVSAIQIAARAIASMKLGRVDAETTANIGILNGGIADNIIPPKAVAVGEARSLKTAKLEAQSRHMRRCFEQAARALKGKVQVQQARAYPAVNIPKDAAISRLTARAAKNLGKTLRFRRSGGASDANVLFNRGLEIADIGCGMRDIHTVREWLDLNDFQVSAELVLETLRLVAQP